jgi:hypothetical protein
LDNQRVWGGDTIYSRLIGTLVINEINRAISDIFRGSSGQYLKPFYMYLDEAGQFMTPKVADILRLKRKTPLKFALTHIDFDHIPNPDIASAIRTGAIHKVLFYTPNVDDRKKMMSDMGYGGQLPDREVLYTLGDLKKQHASIRIFPRRPALAKIMDVPDPNVSHSVLTAYVQDLYKQDWFYSAAEIDSEINARFQTTVTSAGGFGEKSRNRSKSPRQRQVRHNKTAGEPVPTKPEGKTYFDD